MLSASQWIPWIAKEAKLYEKYGMEAELVLLRGSGQSAQAIIGGSILGAPCTLTTVMGAQSERRGSRDRGAHRVRRAK